METPLAAVMIPADKMEEYCYSVTISGRRKVVRDMVKVSVIVPIYNVEIWLEECLESLLTQGLSDTEYEVICVDDGSTDRSGSIAAAYAERYRQIILIRQENKGSSGARNAGLRAARGKYIYFIDSDDWLDSGALGALYHLAERSGLDKLAFDYMEFQDGTGKRDRRNIPLDEDKLRLFQTGLQMEGSGVTPAWKIVWNYLVRRSIVLRYGLQFVEGAPQFEDQEFNFWLDHCVGPCGYLDQKLYHYRKRDSSVLHTFMEDGHFQNFVRGRQQFALRYQTALQNFRAGRPPDLLIPISEQKLEYRMIDEVQGILNRLISKGDRDIFETSLRFLKENRLYPYPLRPRRLFRKGRNHLADVVSFLFPVEWILRLCMAVRGTLRRVL